MKLKRPLIWITLCLAVPVIPFLLLGEGFETAVAGVVQAESSSSAVAILVVGLLAADILLPIPSSTVCTVAAYRLGFLPGILASFLGLSIGSIIAFGAARFLGHRFVRRHLSESEAEEAKKHADRWGVWLVILARPVPILAEASVLWLGTTRLPWRSFLAALTLANLAVASVYGVLGTTVPPVAAIILSALAPLVLLAGVRFFAKRPA